MEKQKWLHFADFQVQARQTELGNRYDESNAVIQEMKRAISTHKADAIIIAGDLFEVAMANADEIRIVKDLFQHIEEVGIPCYIIIGNHDIKQKSNAVLVNGETVNVGDHIETCIPIGSKYIHYMKETGFYPSPIDGVDFAVWSQYAKFKANQNNKTPYSPWQLPQATDVDRSKIIELYHDPFSGCSDFADMPTYESHGGLSKFQGASVIAGDIHKYGSYLIGEMIGRKRWFNYCGSTMMRNFGEGDYITNGLLTQNGNTSHGYSVITMDGAFIESIEQVAIAPPVGRTTIRLDKDFTPDQIDSLVLYHVAPKNEVRVVIESNENGLMNHEDQITGHLNKLYDCHVSFDYDTDILVDMATNGVSVSSVSELLSKPVITKITKEYVSAIVNKTKTITPEQAQQAEAELMEIFTDELAEIDMFRSLRKVELLHAVIRNFAVFGDHVSYDFKTGLTRFTGTNGVGKTMVFRFVYWMLCDQITQGIPRSKKSLTRGLIFNDFLKATEVNGELTLMVDGVKWTIEKYVTRKLKRDGSTRGVPTQELKLTIGEDVLTNEDAQKQLDGLVSSNEWNMFLFINHNNLTNLLNTDEATLNETILRTIGFDVIDRMGERLDELKQERLSGLVKPVGSIADMIEQAKGRVVERDTKLNIIEETKRSLDTLATDLRSLENQRLTLSKGLNNVGTVHDVKRDIFNLSNKAESLRSNIDELRDYIEISRSNIDKQADVRKVQLDNDLSSEQEKRGRIDEKISALREQIETLEANIKLIEDVEGAKYDNRCATQQQEIDNYRTSIENETNVLESIKNVIIAEKKRGEREHQQKLNAFDSQLVNFDAKIETQEQIASNVTNTLRGFDNEIEKYESQIELLEHTKSCPTCQRMYDETTVEAVKANIAEIENKINALREEKASTKANDKTGDVIKQLREERQAVNLERGFLMAKPYVFDKTSELGDKFRQQHTKLAQMKDNLSKSESALEAFKSAKTEVVEKELSRNSTIIDTKARIAKLTDQISEQETEKDTFKTREDAIRAKIEDAVRAINKNREIDNTIENYNKEIETKKGELQETVINSENRKTDLVKAEADEALTEQLKRIDEEIQPIVQESKEQTNVLNGLRVDCELLNKQIEQSNEAVELAKEYKFKTSVLDLYSTMLGKKGVSKYLFGKVVDLLNHSLNNLLSGTNFRLSFDKDTYTLRFFDLLVKSSRPVTLTSGMETTISGLALVNTLMSLNQNKQYGFQFIDEITGTLNNGKNLTTKAINYQKMLVDLLGIIKRNGTNLYVVDHVIEDMLEDRNVEVRKTPQGAELIH